MGLPFLIWFFIFKMQSPIPHPTRVNYLENLDILKVFFFDNYGAFFLMIPIVLLTRHKKRIDYALILAFLFYFILGLGGTTPFPKIVFGYQWEWLTYERFGTWATIFLVILVGKYIASIKDDFGTYFSYAFLLSALLFASLWLFNPEAYLTTIPKVDLRDVYSSFTQNKKCEDRYLAFGFGYQLPEISTFSDAKTLDGLWHTARSDQFLRNSGIGALSDALTWDNGTQVLKYYLSRNDINPANCIYVNENDVFAWKYKRVLRELSWISQDKFNSEISLWVKAGTATTDGLITQVAYPKMINEYWGLMPLGFLLFFGVLNIIDRA